MRARSPRMPVRLPRLLLLGLLATFALTGCAWSNRANRPVWNAFEAQLVPDDTTAFYATLPLTIPGGLLCILTDSFVVHPAQVADDAWEDAGDLWSGIGWDSGYYTQLAILPLRVVGTPVVFVVMFLARSMFDIPPHGTQPGARTDDAPSGEPEDSDVDDEAAAERAFLDALAAMAQAQPTFTTSTLKRLDPPARWTEALARGYDDALAHGRALDRVQLYRYAQRHKLPPWSADPARGLRDPDPVVRYLLLDQWPAGAEVPAEVQAALLADPDEAVRQLALQRWP